VTTIPERDPARDDAALAALRHEYPQWTIGYEAALHVFTAEWHGGPVLRFLAGHDIDELAARLATATKVGP